jgi:autotransporter-associated beta strand protein
MKPKFYTRQRHTNLIQSLVLTLGIAGILFLDSAQAQTVRTWDGGAGGTGTVLNTAANWSSDTAPTANGDTARWNGTVAGNLALTYNPAFGNSTSGVSIDITGAQTGSLQIGSTVTNTDAFSLGSLTIAANAGAFTFGNGSGNDRLTFRGTNTLTNDSANTATFASDVVFFSGGGTGRTLAFGGSGNWQVDAPLTIGSGGSGSFAVTKAGAGTLTLAAATNGYSGATSVTAGTLIVNGNISTSVTTVASTATLAGTGTVGAASVNGTLTPGDGGIESLNFTSLTLSNTSSSQFEINTAGDAADLAIASAAMFFDGALTVTNIGAALANGDVFNLFDWSSASGTFDSVSLPSLTGDLTWDQSQLYTSGTITVIPEPSAALLGGLGLLVLLRRKRA